MRIFLRLRFNLRVRFFFHLAVRVERRRRRRDIFVGQFCFAREKDTTTLFHHHHHHFQRERARRRRRRRIGLKNENLATARHPNAPPKRPPKRTRLDFHRIRRFSSRAFRASFLPARGRVVLFLFFFRARASSAIFFCTIASRTLADALHRRRKTQPPPPTRHLPVGKKSRIVFVVKVVVVKVVSRTSHFPCALF